MNKDTDQEKFLGSNFSAVPLHSGDSFTRPSAGGGGYGDPLDRPFDEVLEDVIDEYVSIERAAKDYGVVIREIDRELDQFEIDHAASAELRQQIRTDRHAWLTADPVAVAEKYRAGAVDMLDVIRRHGVILDWGTGELFPETTSEFRKSMQKRSSSHWH